MRVLAIADTHIARRTRRRMPEVVWREAEAADVVLHAGDVLIPEVLAELEQYAPVHAVLGNNDKELVDTLPTSRILDLDGLRVGMVHDSGQAKGRERRLHKWFPDCELVVFGHSHIPVNREGHEGQWLLNPGSPTERRRQPHHTMATFDVVDGRLVDPKLVVVEPQDLARS